MPKKILVLIMIMLFAAQPVFAGLIVDRSKRKVSSLTAGSGDRVARPVARAAASPKWQTASLKAETWTEKRYDKNRNGLLEPQEAKELLKARYKSIRNKYQPAVETVVERQYDLNGNNKLEAGEKRAIVSDIY